MIGESYSGREASPLPLAYDGFWRDTSRTMTCPICKSDAKTQVRDFAGAAAIQVDIDCPRCGPFGFTEPFVLSRPNLTPENVATISGWIRENQGVQLRKEDWPRLQTIRPLAVGEKADRLLLLLTKKFPTAGEAVHFSAADPEVISRCWATGNEEASYLYNSYLTDHKHFLVRPTHGGQSWRISPSGWDYIHSLGRINPGSQIGFCAMWFDERMEVVWTKAIQPAITDAGFEPKRIDQHPHNNRIDDEMISMIRRSRFLVADLTGNRAGVYFEAGFAFGLQLPVIWSCRDGRLGRVHFDNRQYNFVLWQEGNLEQFRTALRYRIEATVGRGPL